MPTLYILGGANGVGKTTWYSTGIEKGYVDPSLPFLNSDNIQKELGAYNAENAIIAEEIVKNSDERTHHAEEGFHDRK